MRFWMGIIIGLLVGVGGTALVFMGGHGEVAADCPGVPGSPCGNGDVNGDGYIDISDATYLLWYLFGDYPKPVAISPFGTALPATGQTKCYAESILWEETDCAIAEIPGQDGFYQSGCPMEGRFVNNGDGTVTDNCTGLMWQQATADLNGDGIITPGDWLNPGPDQTDWQGALQCCESLEFADHTDWRLPNVRELQSIVDYGRWHLTIDPVFSAELSWYWSSSSHVGDPNGAWGVDFHLGIVSGGVAKNEYHYVRAVRGGL